MRAHRPPRKQDVTVPGAARGKWTVRYVVRLGRAVLGLLGCGSVGWSVRKMGVSSVNMPNLVFSAIYGVGFFIMLNVVGVYGYGIMPLFPFQLENIEWAFTWLIQTIFD